MAWGVIIKSKPYIKEITVAMISDPFTYNSFKFEFNAIPIEPTNWKKIFKTEDIDLLFVESTFNGVGKKNIMDGIALETEHRPWAGKIGINQCRNIDNRTILFEIITCCKNNGIPTIFWNKEDPISFDNKEYNFVDTALHFDYIFTTDANMIQKYKDKGHTNVYSLPFASQVKLFNPIKNDNRSEDIIFAGSWYNQFHERCSVMRKFFDIIINSKYHLKIYDRASDLNSENRKFPEKYSEYIHPKVPNNKMPKIYKESKFALNINTVTNSKTMFARRVFELMSSNTFVISNYSIGVYELFKDNVYYLDKENEIKFDNLSIEKICEDNLYNILNNHTYFHRFKYILDIIGFNYKDYENNLYIIYLIENDITIENIVNDFRNTCVKNKHGIIICDDKIQISESNKKLIEKSKIDLFTYNEFVNLSKSFNEEDFFVIREMNIEILGFIEKAILHFAYIDNQIGITEDSNKKYQFDKVTNYTNIIFKIRKLKEIFEAIKTKSTKIFDIYYI